jgi:hypothetical protein
VLFVGGYARTGSTLLDRMLGQVDGFASFGELRHVWDRSFRGDQLCGCGERFHDCPFWSAVVREAFGGWAGVDGAAVSRDKRAVDALWQVPSMLSGGWTAGYRARLGRYRAAVAALYRGIASVSGAEWVVDSTKDPQHAFLLSTIPGFDVRAVHLVRDSRAVAHSWRRTKRRPEIFWREQDMPRFPVTRTALAWDVTNLAMHAAGWRGMPRALLRYEDLVRRPREELHRVFAEIGLGARSLDFVGDGEVRLGVGHTVAGNPIRFDTGTVRLRPDEAWRREMDRPSSWWVAGLTLPGLAAYGYLGREAARATQSSDERVAAS